MAVLGGSRPLSRGCGYTPLGHTFDFILFKFYFFFYTQEQETKKEEMKIEDETYVNTAYTSATYDKVNLHYQSNLNHEAKMV